MDLKIVGDVYKNYGLLGLIILLLGGIIVYIIWDRWQDFKKEKAEEENPTETKVAIDRLNGHFSLLKEKLEKHLEKEAQEDIVIAVMKNEQENQGKEIVETKQDVQNIYKLMSEIKTLIIQQGQNR